MADHRRVGGKDGDAIEPRRHAPSAPQIALDIAAETVRRPFAGIDENAPIGEPRAVLDHVENTDETRPRTGFDNVELSLIGRKTKTVWPVDVAGYDRGGGGPAVHSIDVGRQFRRRLLAFVITEDAEGRIGEPDRTVGFDDHVVRRVEPLAVEPVENDGDRAVILGAGDPPPLVLAGDEPALAVAAIAVGVVGGFAV